MQHININRTEEMHDTVGLVSLQEFSAKTRSFVKQKNQNNTT